MITCVCEKEITEKSIFRHLHHRDNESCLKNFDKEKYKSLKDKKMNQENNTRRNTTRITKKNIDLSSEQGRKSTMLKIHLLLKRKARITMLKIKRQSVRKERNLILKIRKVSIRKEGIALPKILPPQKMEIMHTMLGIVRK